MSTIEVLNNPDVANELIESLDNFARNYNSFEYGLPTETAEMAAMREIVLKWLAKLEAAEQSVRLTGLTPRQKEEVRQMIQSALDTGSA